MAFPHFTNIVIHNFSSEMNIHKVFHFTPMLCIMFKKLIGIWENAQIRHNSSTLNIGVVFISINGNHLKVFCCNGKFHKFAMNMRVFGFNGFKIFIVCNNFLLKQVIDLYNRLLPRYVQFYLVQVPQ